MQVEGVAGKVVAITTLGVLGNDAVEASGSTGGRQGREKYDVDPGSVGSSLVGKRIGSNEAVKFFMRSEDHAARSAHELLKSSGDGLRYLVCRAWSVEDGVAGLNVRLDVAVAEVFEELAKVGHGQLAGSAKVYGTKKRNAGFHRALREAMIT